MSDCGTDAPSRIVSRIESAKDGCDTCREDERRTRFVWQTVLPDAPLSNQCSSCNRSYTLTHLAFTWLPPQPRPKAPPSSVLQI